MQQVVPLTTRKQSDKIRALLATEEDTNILPLLLPLPTTMGTPSISGRVGPG